MTRILKAVALTAVLALAAGATAYASSHAVHRVTARTAANAACPDPAHCTRGSCPVGARGVSATAASTAGAAQASGKVCPKTGASGGACPHAASSAMAANAAKH